jgi:ribosomal protein S27E
MSKETTPIETHSSINIINTTPQNKINRVHNSSNFTENDSNEEGSEVPIYNEDYTNEKNNLQQYYINKADYIANELKYNIIPEIESGHLAIKCWNCQNVNIVKGNLKNIKCSICQEINKVPKPIHKFDEILDYLRAAQLRNYADEKKTIPLTHYVVNCPYCKTENKIRENALYCICYRCDNRWTIKRPQDDDISLNPPQDKNEEKNYYKYGKRKIMEFPKEKILRFSDLFFPDPMFYPGFYPINSISPLYYEYFNPYDEYLMKDRINKIIMYGNSINQQKLLYQNQTLNNKINDFTFNNGNINNNYNSNRDSYINNLNNNLDNNNFRHSYSQLNVTHDVRDSDKYELWRQIEEADRKSKRLIENRYLNNDGTIRNNTTKLNYSYTPNPKKISDLGNDKLNSYQKTFLMKKNDK